jgi:hypothetical protein
MEKANTRGTAGATGVVVALEPVSEMAADITDDRALGGNLRVAACPERVLRRALASYAAYSLERHGLRASACSMIVKMKAPGPLANSSEPHI